MVKIYATTIYQIGLKSEVVLEGRAAPPKFISSFFQMLSVFDENEQGNPA
jgi:hypothetical protein